MYAHHKNNVMKACIHYYLPFAQTNDGKAASDINVCGILVTYCYFKIYASLSF